MKRMLIALLIIVPSLAFAEVAQTPQKFETTITITYNSISLEEAAEIEKQVKRNHVVKKDACKVEIKLREVNGGLTTSFTTGPDTIFWDGGELDLNDVQGVINLQQ